MSKYLTIAFTLDDGKSVSYRIQNPKEDLTDAQVNEAMQIIMEQNTFHKGGASIVAKKSAQIVDRKVQHFTMN